MSETPSRPIGGAAPLLPDDWKELSSLLDVVLDAPPERRDAVLTELSAGDPARRIVLERLLAEAERDMPLLNRPALERFDQLVRDDGMVLPENLGGRYRIQRELGRGGMARVYLAHDAKHTRDVAVKVIRPELAASLGRERFLREIAIAARLRHPNIVPLYDSGDADGVLYFVMPYEDGPSLRLRLQEGALPVVECVSVLRDVARALAYAHEQGVVHRDVKPDNVMMSGGAAVVTDFGIAKAVSVAQTGAAAGTLTQSGAGIGTPAYMAPEQAVGDPSTDHRADIYSFGCLAYELFAGKPPFHNMPAHQIIGAHVGTKPIPITEVTAEVPDSIGRLIARCLEKQPDARPQSARELLGLLEETVTLAQVPRSYSAVPSRRGRYWWVGLAAAAAVIGTAAYVGSHDPDLPPPITVAVLPFGNISADSAMDFVAEGLAEAVAASLRRVPGIQIKSVTGARGYRGQLSPDVADAGAKLKVDHLMTGVVRQDRGRWILSATLERVSDLTTLWDSTFSVSQDQQSVAAEAIARSLVAGLRLRFPQTVGTAPTSRANQGTSSNEAFRLTMLGQGKITRRSSSVKESADLFTQAIRLDPSYALAHSGLSMALALFPYFQRVPANEIRERVISAARRALELDSTLSQPHVALGMAYQVVYQWDRAAAEFQTAIQLDRRNVEARVQYARHLRFRGRDAEALSELRVARDEDPVSALVLGQLAYSFYIDHQIDSAVFEFRRAWQNDSTSMAMLGNGARVLFAANLVAEALKLADRAPAFASNDYLFAKSGDTAKAHRRIRERDAATPQPWMAETMNAMAYLGLGEPERAVSALERATEGKEIWYASSALNDPMYDSIRDNPRFRELLRKVGLAR